MHVDALQARRTKAGAPVVHGINLLLWALDSLSAAQHDLPRFRSLRAQFNRFVYLNERVEVVLTQQEPTSVRLNICVDGAIRSKVAIEFGDGVEDCPLSFPHFVPAGKFLSCAAELKFSADGGPLRLSFVPNETGRRHSTFPGCSQMARPAASQPWRPVPI